MLYDRLTELYNNMRLRHYRRIFSRVREKAGSLSATEAFSLDSVYLLGEPTIKQFSEFLGISQPNATYKIASLTEKGYITRTVSDEDHREALLHVSDKFFSYYGDVTQFLESAVGRLESSFSKEELASFGRVLEALNEMVKGEDI